jgi:hypothetical protein
MEGPESGGREPLPTITRSIPRRIAHTQADRVAAAEVKRSAVIGRIATLQINRAGLVAIALAAILLASVGGTLYLWQFAPLTVDQRIAAVSASLSAGAFLIAVLAGIIALQAYRDAIRKPRLHLVIDANRGPFATVNLSLTNEGSTSARNIIVWLQFQDTVDASAYGWISEASGRLRWQSRAGVVIHRTVSYALPPVTVQKQQPDQPLKIAHTVVADGFGPVTGDVAIWPFSMAHSMSWWLP